jgi:hypothetical protein
MNATSFSAIIWFNGEIFEIISEIEVSHQRDGKLFGTEFKLDKPIQHIKNYLIFG